MTIPRKKFVALAAAAVVAISLAGCGSGGSPETDSNAGGTSSYLYERSVTLTDGRQVTCIVYIAGYAGGVDCDWDNARMPG